jgi:hypothetical protein
MTVFKKTDQLFIELLYKILIFISSIYIYRQLYQYNILQFLNTYRRQSSYRANFHDGYASTDTPFESQLESSCL